MNRILFILLLLLLLIADVKTQERVVIRLRNFAWAPSHKSIRIKIRERKNSGPLASAPAAPHYLSPLPPPVPQKKKSLGRQKGNNLEVVGIGPKPLDMTFVGLWKMFKGYSAELEPYNFH